MPHDFPSRPPRRSTTRDTTRLARDSQERGTIRPAVRYALWGKSAGRCTLCNRRVLNEAKTFWHSIAAAEMGHIIGATTTEGSPRGLQELDREIDLEAEDNLLLCCHDCHRMIDDADHVEYFTPAKLRALKSAHEDRIELATSEGVLTRTAVIRVGSDVRGSYSIASRREVAETLFANNYLGLVESRRSGQFDCNLVGEATDEAYWAMARSQLDRTLGQVSQAVAQEEIGHISVFAIAPIPALVLLGARLDDKVETRLWQKHRDVGWSWPGDGDPDITFSFTAEAVTEEAEEVVLVCSLSAEADQARIPVNLRGAPRLTLRPDNQAASPTLMTTEKSLKNFGIAFRDMLAAAEMSFPGARRWHLIAATPLAASVEAGRAFMREVHPPVDVYQRTAAGTYQAVVTVNENPDQATTATNTPGGQP